MSLLVRRGDDCWIEERGRLKESLGILCGNGNGCMKGWNGQIWDGTYSHGTIILFMLWILRAQVQGVHELFLGDSRTDGGHGDAGDLDSCCG